MNSYLGTDYVEHIVHVRGWKMIQGGGGARPHQGSKMATGPPGKLTLDQLTCFVRSEGCVDHILVGGLGIREQKVKVHLPWADIVSVGSWLVYREGPSSGHNTTLTQTQRLTT